MTSLYAPGEAIIALVGLVLVLGGGVAIYFLFRGRRRAYLTAFAASSVIFIAMLFAWAALRIDRHQHSRPLLEAVRSDSPAAPQIAAYKYCDASTVYYAHSSVTEIDDGGKLRRFIRQSPHPYVITTGDRFNDLEAQMPGEWRVVARRARFLSKGDIIVIAPNSAKDEAIRHTETTARTSGDTLRE